MRRERHGKEEGVSDPMEERFAWIGWIKSEQVAKSGNR